MAKPDLVVKAQISAIWMNYDVNDPEADPPPDIDTISINFEAWPRGFVVLQDMIYFQNTDAVDDDIANMKVALLEQINSELSTAFTDEQTRFYFSIA